MTTPTMTPEAQRVAIAQTRGWKFSKNEYGAWFVTRPDGAMKSIPGTPEQAISPDFGPDILKPFGLPDYLNDLNAMAEARKTLTPEEQEDFLKWLGYCGENDTSEVFGCVDASAAQQAAAYLKAKNLWTT